MMTPIQNFDIFSNTGNVVYPMVRIILGLLFFFQAYDKIFRVKFPAIFEEVIPAYSQMGIPKWFARYSIYLSSYLELIYGLLLIVGLFTTLSLYIISFHMVMVILSFSLLQGMWDMKHVFPRLVLLVFLLMLPQEWNILSFDYFFFL